MVMGQTGLSLAPPQQAEHSAAVSHLQKPWSCDLVCGRPLRSSLLLWRKLLQLFADYSVPLISCQLCRAEQFLAAGSPPSSPPPSLAEWEPLSFQHLEVWSAAWGAWGSRASLLPGSRPSHAGSSFPLKPSMAGCPHCKATKRQQEVPALLQCLLFLAWGYVSHNQERWVHPAWLHPAWQQIHMRDKVDFSWASWREK